MCNPVVATLVTTAFASYGQYRQGQDQADVYRSQARSAEDQAQSVREVTAIQEMRQVEKTRRLLATQTAMAGASGADVQSSSFGKVMEQTATMGAEDALTIRMQGLQQAWGLSQQARALRYQGDATAAAGRSQAIGTALTGFAKAWSQKTEQGYWFKKGA